MTNQQRGRPHLLTSVAKNTRIQTKQTVRCQPAGPIEPVAVATTFDSFWRFINTGFS